jgi:hypothetical protein
VSDAGTVPLLSGVFALTFLSEDAAVLSAAALVATGAVAWPLAFAACFLGIWLGDLWLYGMARAFGAPFVSRFGKGEAIARSRAWFEKRGSLVLVASRFVPGSRLPCYLAAGAMRFSLSAFVLVTGAAAAVWVGLILAGAQAPWLVLGVAVAGGVWRAWSARAPQVARHSTHTRWEFWPAWVFYAPVAFFYGWLAVRHRSFTLPTAANPGLPMGGLVGESKFDTLRLLALTAPDEVAPTWLIAPGDTESRLHTLSRIVERRGVTLPFILKPDVGQRGMGVKLIRSLEAAREYLAAVQEPVLLQRYAPGPREAGIFYYRLPGASTGRLFAITEKVFPAIEGDGVRTLEELILADPRAAKIAETYLRRFAGERDRVLSRGETRRLVEAGNHAQGCIFRDGAHLETPELLAAIDRISQALPGFSIGRFDVRYTNDAELRTGRGFTIVELNGAGAEATCIYDARHTLRAAYRTLWRQWALVFQIGAHHRARGVRPARLAELLREWLRTSRAISTYPPAD